MNSRMSPQREGKWSSLLGTRLMNEGLWVTTGQLASVLTMLVSIRILTELPDVGRHASEGRRKKFMIGRIGLTVLLLIGTSITYGPGCNWR